MEYDNNFYDKLIEISDKINQIETVQKTDIMQIKASIGSLTRYIADTQETVNFSEVQSRLDSLSYKIESCNNVVAKDLSGDISSLKNALRDLENMQRETLKASQFEDFKNQHINLTVKNNESLLAYIKNIKTSFENIASHMSGLQKRQNEVLTGEEFEKAKRQSDENTQKANENILKELDYIKSAAENIKNYQKYMVTEENFASLKTGLNDVKYAVSEIQKQKVSPVDIEEIRSLQEEIRSVKLTLDYLKLKQENSFSSEDADLFGKELSDVKLAISNIQNMQDSAFTKDEYSVIRDEFSSVKDAINEIRSENVGQINKNDFDNLLGEISNIKAVLADIQNIGVNNSSSDTESYLKDELSEIRNTINDIKEKQNSLLSNDELSSISSVINDIKERQASLLSQEEFTGLKNDLGTVKESISNIMSELNSVKNAAYAVKSDNDEVTAGIKSKLEELHFNLKDYVEQITSKINTSPSISEIGAVVSDISGLHRDDIKQTSEKLQELQNSLSAFESDFRNNDFGAKLSKINDIYSSINKINDWIDKVGYINQSLETVYARFGENADFDDISNKVDIIYENMSLFNSGMKQLDNISAVTSEITAKLPDLMTVKDTSSAALDAVSSIKNRIGELFSSETDIEDITNKIDIIYENLFLLNEKTAKVDEINSVVCDIKNKTNAFEAIKNETGDLAFSVSGIKEKLDTVFAHPEDIEEVVNKIDILYENLSALNEREAKTDEIASAVYDIKSDLSKIDGSDVIKRLNEISITANALAKADDTQNIHEGLALIAKKLENTSTLEDAENILEKINEISNKSDIITSEMFDGGFIDKINALSDKINLLNDNIDDELVFSKIDLIYENIGLLNTWVNKLDDLSEKNEIINRRFNTKMEEISEQLEKLSLNLPGMKENLDLISGELNTITKKTKDETESYIYTLLDIEADFLKIHKSLDESKKETGEEIKALKESFGEITQDISSISVRTNKLILSADDANKEFEKCLTSFKEALSDFEAQNKTLNPTEKFNALQVRLESIYQIMKQNMNASKNLNTAFTYLGNWADGAGAMITSSANDIAEIKNQSSGFASAIQNLNGCMKTVSGISDAVKITLKQNQLCLNEIAGIKETVAKLSEAVNGNAASSTDAQSEEIKTLLKDTQDKLSLLEDGFSAFKNDDVSEIKSLMTGVTVQLGTSLRPDIDSLNNKIEQISEEEESKFTGFETLIQEKIAKQEKQILSLEEKLDNLTSKIDKLADSVSETSQDNQIKDVLNYIASQLAETNENGALIKEVAEKVSSFDTGINKIVSYIEE